jgi:long-chain acyl-CoA synthetase
VPRIYEKVYQGIQKKVQAGSFAERHALKLALEASRLRGAAVGQGRKPSLLARAELAVAERLVFRSLRERFGGRLRFAISGGAPLPREIAEFFEAAGLKLLEGYGLTETTGPIAFNTVRGNKPGTVGRVWPGSEARVAEDGEFLVRGPSVFSGYHENPEGTAEALKDGWFATGDVGEIDVDGYLRITDRKKDLIVTAGGKNVAPQKIEGLLRGDPLISNALVVGDRRNYLAALITLTPDETKRVAVAQGWEDAKSVEKAATDLRFRNYLKDRIQRVNAGLAPYETVKRFKILPRDFTIEAGELTPSLKVKRKFCVQKYAKLIDEIYDPAGEGRQE